MADIKFTPKARNANAVSGESFENGSMIVATDTGELYVDYNGARMRIGDVITLDTEAQRIATLAPLPKLYWVAETGKLWRFADNWVCINPDDIEADTVKADIVQAGRRYYNVATVSSSASVYEIVIKTRIPKADQASVNAIYLYGVCGNNVVNTMFSTYWQNDSVKFPWRNMVQAGSISFEGKIFTYEDDGTEYVGIALLPGTTGLGTQTSIYYPRFQVDFTDLIGSIRDYSKGWTVELNTVKNSESIIPQTNIMDCIKSKLVTDIYGSATSLATPRTIALTGGATGTATSFDGTKNIQIPVTSLNPNNLSSAVPITKGGTGATTAANARTALEAGYTIRRTITTTGAGWYRIAATTVSVGRNYTDVYIDARLAGKNSQIGLIAAVTYGSSTTEPTAIQLTQKACVEQYKDGVTKARIVYVNGGYSSKYAYLEIYQAYDAAATYSIEFQNCRGWATRYDEPIAGEIPDGYSARELTFVHNAVVADNFVGLLYPPDNAGINSLRTPTISEVACIPEMLADRLQFFPATKCMAETSTDGTSWTTKTVSASQWNSLLCCNPSYPAGLTWNNGTQLRLTFTYNTYVALSMLYLYVATGSRLKVIIERYRNSTKDWVELASMGGIVGQPQHVTLWHDAILFTNTSNDSYSSQVRVTLIHEGNSTDTPRIDMLRWKGGYPAVNPNIYNWDPNKNVTFPTTVTAANFKGYWEWLLPAPRFNENSTSTIPTCKQVADYIKSLIGG